jgi:hypothetical protein
MNTHRVLASLTAGILVSTLSANATPYASGVTNLSGNGTKGGTIQFILNEPADNVYVIFGDSSSNAIASPGTTGVKTFPLGSETSFAIHCVKAGSGAISQISSDANALNTIGGQRGVAVSPNANNWRFGRIYVSKGTAGGIFCRNADQSDVFGQGSTTGRTAGIPFVGSSYSPWRLFVGPDGTLYISSTSTLAGGGFLGEADGDVLTGGLALTGAYNSYAAGQNHTDLQGTPVVTGSIAGGNLVVNCFDVYYPINGNGGNNLLQWNIGSGPFPSSVTPTGLASQANSGSFVVSDDAMTPNFFYLLENRANETGSTPSLMIFSNPNTSGTAVWDSANNSISPGNDLFYGSTGVSVSPDGQYLAVLNGYTSLATVVKLVNGIPDETTMVQVPGATTAVSSYGSVCWDAADNLYSVCSGLGLMRVYSLGLTANCVTGNDYTGTNGIFQFGMPSASVSVVATTPQAYQANNSYVGNGSTPTPAVFTVSLNAAQSSSTTVNFTLGGTATNGVQYNASINGVNQPKASSYSVVFPAGVTTENVTITPIGTASGPTYLVVLNLSGGVTYSAVVPSSATAYIANSGPQSIGITAGGIPSMYRGISNDFATFIITRYGDTNAASFTIPANAFSYAGTATVGVDYHAVSSPVTVNTGDITEGVTVANPVATGVYHGNESILVSLNANAGVPIASGSLTANLTLVDNADPPATVLWADSLTNASDSVNWTLTFANSNLSTTTVPPVIYPNYPNFTSLNPDPNPLDDFDVEFGYGITNDFVGASPAMLLNNWTNALKMTVNKTSGYLLNGGGCSAGVNVYPKGMKFSGNYAFRFSMNLSEGSFSTTEYDIFGINHYGTNCNWFAEDIAAPIGSAGSYETNQDGIWYWIDADNNGLGSYSFAQVYGPPLPNSTFNVYTYFSGAVAPFTNDFKSPAPYNCSTPGMPVDGYGLPANTWADVEVKQVNGLITMSINKFPIMTYTNTTNANMGDIMLGYDDPYASIGASANAEAPGAAVYYSNARVVQLTPPAVTGLSVASGNLTIKFTDSDTDDTAASFELLASSTVKGTYAKVAATFSQSTSGVWQAVVAVPGSGSEFYQVVRIN